MKKSYYFSHDYHARSDPKLLKLRRELGMEGIGIFWCVVEIMYENEGELPIDMIDDIAFELHSDCERIAKVLDSYNLFEKKENAYTSKTIRIRLDKQMSKSDKARKSAKVRWVKEKRVDTNAMRTQCNSNAIKERKGKEKKRKKEEYKFEDLDLPLALKEMFEGWVEVRNKKHKPASLRSIKASATQIRGYSTAIQKNILLDATEYASKGFSWVSSSIKYKNESRFNEEEYRKDFL